ncbi:glycoside hydrolase family 97 catalytic domain-containing protein [Parapedobacter sp. 2B3]|uniref:glycoside hydrolase family 97 protein n=1 Tax=Parapedobacter sp. 2B3 TaxID=3342381 RepID=UPI0035B67D69
MKLPSDMLRLPFIITLFFHLSVLAATDSDYAVTSPDGRLVITIRYGNAGQLYYSVAWEGKTVLEDGRLGVIGRGIPVQDQVRIVAASGIQRVTDVYEIKTAKRRLNTYRANRRVWHVQDGNGRRYDLIFQVSDDGVAFRYYFPDPGPKGMVIDEELTSFRFPAGAKAWLQPMAVAKSGWEQTNPSYEEHYRQGIPVGTPEPTGTGWIYPALFQVDSTWLLLTEADLDGRYCATRLRPESPGGEYRIGFPDTREVMPGGGLLPESSEPFHSPWRVITVGSLATIAQSNLGLDVATEAIAIAGDVVKPGKSSWSWINSKDDHITYDEQRRYIDFAADMDWQYCLIDVNWDRKIGYGKIKELAEYAATKGVGLLLWYNSAGDWNTVKYTPKNRLLTREARCEEFARIKAMGIKGVKIDFFGGDGRSVIQYYIDILDDAAAHGLLVNFHGATLPRGWSRTYPHLMTVEAVRGFEMVTFGQDDADRQATHATILPFTRNAFDPMDYTPMNLSEVRTQVERRTTAAFELATSVLFLSGIQHYAESPEGIAQVPEYVRAFLRELPDSWDDVRFIDGFPGRYVAIARKSGSRWYIAGINGETHAKRIRVDLAAFEGVRQAVVITDGYEPGTFKRESVPLGEQLIDVKPNGGFTIVLE